jgi:hypothetical protein
VASADGTLGRPILGMLLAERIAGATPSLSLAPFDPARYVGAAHPPRWLESFGGAPIER